jgi:ribosomal protein L32
MNSGNEPPVGAESTFEMLWDCKHCGQKKLLGLSHRCCPNCGAPQDAGARYFPSDEDKVAVQNHPYMGADVACPACQSWNSRAAKCCRQCGGPLAAGASAQLRSDQVQPLGGTPAQAAPAMPARRSRAWIWALLAAAVVLIGGIVAVLSLKRSGSFQVTAHTWTRTIDVERQSLVRNSAWCDSLPMGAHELGRHKEQRGATKVADGQDCQMRKKDNGDGTFRQVKECQPKYKDQPVYADRCDYEALAWTTERTAKAEGALASPPAWPPTNLRMPGSCNGCEREGSRSETYTVMFRDEATKENLTCSTSQATWAAMHDGSRWDGSVSRVTNAVDCDSLQPRR